jgi:hypothetical protein
MEQAIHTEEGEVQVYRLPREFRISTHSLRTESGPPTPTSKVEAASASKVEAAAASTDLFSLLTELLYLINHILCYSVFARTCFLILTPRMFLLGGSQGHSRLGKASHACVGA